MESEFVRAKTAVAVAYADARHQPEPSGAVIPVDDLADHLKDNLRANDPWLENLFEPATKDDYDTYQGFVETLAEQEESETPDETAEEPVAEEESPAAAMKAQRRRKQRVEEEATTDPVKEPKA